MSREQSTAGMLPEQLMWSEQHSWWTFDNRDTSRRHGIMIQGRWHVESRVS